MIQIKADYLNSDGCTNQITNDAMTNVHACRGFYWGLGHRAFIAYGHCVIGHSRPNGSIPCTVLTRAKADYRLLYWNRFLAPGCPYFFRSLMRESRVNSPSAFKVGRKLMSA